MIVAAYGCFFFKVNLAFFFFLKWDSHMHVLNLFSTLHVPYQRRSITCVLITLVLHLAIRLQDHERIQRCPFLLSILFIDKSEKTWREDSRFDVTTTIVTNFLFLLFSPSFLPLPSGEKCGQKSSTGRPMFV